MPVLPETMLNYLGMMGYTSTDQREIFSFSEMSETFEIKRMSSGGPIFDLGKLKWLNGRYLREQIEPQEIIQRLMDWKANEKQFSKILDLALPRMETLADFFPLGKHLFEECPEYSVEDLVGNMEASQVSRLLKIAEWELGKFRIGIDRLSEIFQKMAEIEELKLKNLLRPFFFAVSGSAVSLPLFDGMALLSPDYPEFG